MRLGRELQDQWTSIGGLVRVYPVPPEVPVDSVDDDGDVRERTRNRGAVGARLRRVLVAGPWPGRFLERVHFARSEHANVTEHDLGARELPVELHVHEPAQNPPARHGRAGVLPNSFTRSIELHCTASGSRSRAAPASNGRNAERQQSERRERSRAAGRSPVAPNVAAASRRVAGSAPSPCRRFRSSRRSPAVPGAAAASGGRGAAGRRSAAARGAAARAGAADRTGRPAAARARAAAGTRCGAATAGRSVARAAPRAAARASARARRARARRAARLPLPAMPPAPPAPPRPATPPPPLPPRSRPGLRRRPRRPFRPLR